MLCCKDGGKEAVLMVADLLHGLNTEVQKCRRAAAGHGHAHERCVLDGEVRQVVTGSQLGLKLLGQRIADASPHVLCGRIGDDGAVHKGMHGAALGIIQILHGAIGIIHHAQRGAAGAVGSQRGERKDRLVQVAGCAFGGIHGTAAADGKDHVGILDLRHGLQHGSVFIGSLAAEPDGLRQLQIRSLQSLLQLGNRNGHCGFAADNRGLLAVGTSNVVDLIVAVRTNAPGRQIKSVTHDSFSSFDFETASAPQLCAMCQES